MYCKAVYYYLESHISFVWLNNDAGSDPFIIVSSSSSSSSCIIVVVVVVVVLLL